MAVTFIWCGTVVCIDNTFSAIFMQDAHEFLNFLLNQLVEILEKECQKATSEPVINGPSNGHVNGIEQEHALTWVHKNFQVNLMDILSPMFIPEECDRTF